MAVVDSAVLRLRRLMTTGAMVLGRSPGPGGGCRGGIRTTDRLGHRRRSAWHLLHPVRGADGLFAGGGPQDACCRRRRNRRPPLRSQKRAAPPAVAEGGEGDGLGEMTFPFAFRSTTTRSPFEMVAVVLADDCTVLYLRRRRSLPAPFADGPGPVPPRREYARPMFTVCHRQLGDDFDPGRPGGLHFAGDDIESRSLASHDAGAEDWHHQTLRSAGSQKRSWSPDASPRTRKSPSGTGRLRPANRPVRHDQHGDWGWSCSFSPQVVRLRRYPRPNGRASDALRQYDLQGRCRCALGRTLSLRERLRRPLETGSSTTSGTPAESSSSRPVASSTTGRCDG